MSGTTDKVRAFGFDQPALLLEAFGLKGPRSRRCISTPRRRVVTKRQVLRHLLTAMRGGLTELDHPQVSRTKHALLSLRDLALARDSAFDWRDLRGWLWFNLQRPRSEGRYWRV
jgi:hypothetical protein